MQTAGGVHEVSRGFIPTHTPAVILTRRWLCVSKLVIYRTVNLRRSRLVLCCTLRLVVGPGVCCTYPLASGETKPANCNEGACWQLLCDTSDYTTYTSCILKFTSIFLSLSLIFQKIERNEVHSLNTGLVISSCKLQYIYYILQ